MSRRDREAWQAWLAADPALRAAWDGFRGVLARVTGQIAEDDPPDLDRLRRAADRVRAEAGDDQFRH